MISKRISAYFIDSLLASTPFNIYFIFFQYRTGQGDNIIRGYNLFFLWSTCYLYFVLQEYYWQQTIGKRILKLRVVKTDNSKLTFTDTLKRHFFDFIELVALPFISVLLIRFSKRHQRIGDQWAGTEIVAVVAAGKTSRIKESPGFSPMIYNRAIAYSIDYFVFLVLLLTYLELFVHKNANGSFTIKWWIAVPVYMITCTLYFAMQEYMWHRTLGKRIMKLKVVKEDNSDLTLLDLLKRHFFDLLEITIFPFIAVVTLLIIGKEQRLGDLMAKTLVVSSGKDRN
jgi:uncharacterized RDD family membrane protein YckC